MLSVGEKFPPFVLNGVNENNEFVQVSVDEGYTPLKNDWSVIYFYPKDFTFICPTEIAGMDMLVDEANVIGISGDNEFCKLVGRVTMDQILFDVTDMDVKIDDEVIILGTSNDKSLNISIKDIAVWNKTIEWEILTNIKDNRLNRIEIDN